MSNGTIGAICGSGPEMTALAYGKAMSALLQKKKVILIQFMKGSQEDFDWSLIKRLEPELKMFHFEKANKCFHDLADDEKEDARLNIRNGLNFAKKVMATAECDLLILDELLGLLEHQIISMEDFKHMISCQGNVELVLTGRVLGPELAEFVESVEEIRQVKIDKAE